MKRKKCKLVKRFVRYIRRTWLNKIVAMAIIGLGILVGVIGDGTGALFMILIGLPLFFAKENQFYTWEP